MCLGVPLKIIEITGNEALGEFKGVRKNIRIDMVQDVSIGDYVMVHAGFALDIMQRKEAEEAEKAIEEICNYE